MNIPKEAIEKAIEGGWEGAFINPLKQLEYKNHPAGIALDPTFWQCLGRALGWFSVFPIGHCQVCGEPMPKGEDIFNYHGYSSDCPKPSKIKRYWGDEAERFVHLILQGKDTTEFWQELINDNK